MIKATKATKNRLHNEDFTPRVQMSTLLEYIVRIADSESSDTAFYTPRGLYYGVENDREANLFAGLASKYPKLIEATLTHGLNQILIPDINKLVKAMLNNR